MLDIKEVEVYVRTKLGQNIVNPEYNNQRRPIHKKILFGGTCNIGDPAITHNKKIGEIFKNDFKRPAIVIYSYEGQCMCYLVTKNDYKYNNYFTINTVIDGMNNDLKLPYLYKGNYNGEGTVYILTDLLIKCNELENNPFLKNIIQ